MTRGERIRARMILPGPVWKRITDSQGMTLVELLISVVMLGLVATLVLGMLVNAIGWNRMAAGETMATAYASEIMEELKSSPGDLGLISGKTYSTKLGNWSALGVDIAGSRDGLEAKVSIKVEDEALALYNVVVEVEWDYRGKRRSVKLVTLVAEV